MMSSSMITAFLRCIVAASLLLWLNYAYGLKIIEALLPLMRREIMWLDDNYQIFSLSLTREAVNAIIHLDFTITHFIVVNDHVIVQPDPHTHYVIGAYATNMLLPVVIGLTLFFAWPSKRNSEYLLRILIGLPVLLLTLLCDTPLVLYNQIWKITAGASMSHDFYLIAAWNDFLQMNGQCVIALFLAAMVIALASSITPDGNSVGKTRRRTEH